MAEPQTEQAAGPAPITIKKYANRRLYNKATSTYVTLDHLAQMIKDGIEFTVHDAKTGEDITRSVLTQIIVEEESKGQNLLPTSFLRHLISFYGDSLQGLVPRYLDHTMQSFAHNQDQIRKYVQEAMGGLFPFARFDEMNKHNMAFFENAMKMFTPFQTMVRPNSTAAPSAEDVKADPAAALDDLKSKLEEMQRRLESLSSAAKK